jgi:hypothetical protein
MIRVLDAIKACTGEERNEHGVDGGAVVTVDEEPISTSETCRAQIQLADVVVKGETAVVEEAAQSDALIARTSKRLETMARLLSRRTRSFRAGRDAGHGRHLWASP